MFRVPHIAIGMLLVLTSAGSLRADDAGTAPQEFAGSDAAIHPFFRHRLMLQGGVAFNNVNSFAKVGAEHRPGTYLSLEDDLGLDSTETAFDAIVRLRLFDRWMIESAHFNVPRERSVSFSRSIDLD